MRFMSMYTPSKDRAGVPPTKEHMAEMAKLIDEATKSGELLATGGLLPISKGARVLYSGRALHRVQGADRRLRDTPVEVKGGGDRISQALPQSGGRR